MNMLDIISLLIHNRVLVWGLIFAVVILDLYILMGCENTNLGEIIMFMYCLFLLMILSGVNLIKIGFERMRRFYNDKYNG